ncbi:hypothetical protein KY289_037188, partial [Solanum tuberosum]
FQICLLHVFLHPQKRSTCWIFNLPHLTMLLVAPLNGITMGDGAAISIPGTFHVVTEKTEVQNFNFSVGLRLICLSYLCNLK